MGEKEEERGGDREEEGERQTDIQTETNRDIYREGGGMEQKEEEGEDRLCVCV